MFATRFTSSSYETPLPKRLHDAFSQPENTATSFSQTHVAKKKQPSTDMRQESTKLLSRYLALVIQMW